MNYYSIKKANLANVSTAFVFTNTNGDQFSANKVIVVSDPSNTQEIYIDWNGLPAVAPSANTKGCSTLPIGGSLTLDNVPAGAIAAIAATSASQIFYIYAFG